ncbi:DUF4407 domain-containing protein [Bacteroides sp.]|uniref:DUF4407 domain-containing protein n=1 Tax=Bacteroides sp. TaxID=29523 RepID=UPI00261DF659|nr:DUF4407 domain-containing protein [Bacteroides sp.]
MGILSKIGCFIIGWNPDILKECGESSYRALRRYMSAIIILMIIWGTIGYCFAERYIEVESVFGKIMVSFGFMLIILCVERFIILHIGRLGATGFFRFVLAVLMAVLGSTVFDQIIFNNDVTVKMKEIRTEQINKEIPRRISYLDTDIRRVTHLIDSIGQENIALYEKLSKNPVITTTDVSTTTKQVGTSNEGKPIEEKITNINKRSVENPINGQVKSNELALKNYQEQLNSYQEKKISVADDVRKEYEMAHVGFLEELQALFSILFENPIAFGFYMFLFMFLMFLELLVVTSKGGDTRCDYELIVEHQLNIKKRTLSETEKRLLNN